MGVKDVKEVEWIEREGPKDHFKTHFLKRMTPTPTWTKRHPGAVYPVLVDHKALITTWQIKFTTGSPSGMKTFAFRTAPNATVKFLAVAAPEEGPPTAWLIYFRHTAQAKDFKNDLLELGGGDYLFGRMQVVTQIARSGKKIGVIIPLAIGSSGEFAGNQAYVTLCLYGAPAKRPLLAASNSDSIFQLQKFLQGCPQLVSRLKAIYDFDGSWRVGTGGISLIVKGVRTFRYDGAAAPNTLTRPQRSPRTPSCGAP